MLEVIRLVFVLTTFVLENKWLLKYLFDILGYLFYVMWLLSKFIQCSYKNSLKYLHTLYSTMGWRWIDIRLSSKDTRPSKTIIPIDLALSLLLWTQCIQASIHIPVLPSRSFSTMYSCNGLKFPIIRLFK